MLLQGFYWSVYMLGYADSNMVCEESLIHCKVAHGAAPSEALKSCQGAAPGDLFT